MGKLDPMLWNVIDLKEERELTAACERSAIQDSFLCRSLYRARKIGGVILNEGGKLSLSKLKKLIKKMESSSLPFYPNGDNDRVAVEHFIDTLSFLLENKWARVLLERFQLPSNRYSEQLVRASLALDFKEKLTLFHVRQAVLSALLTPLRQNVGSCFATAPAILIQREQRERLLVDLYDLMTMCRLTRTFGGVEHGVPISTSSGCGDLKRVVNFKDRAKLTSPSLRAAFKAIKLDISDCPQGVMTIEECLLKALSSYYGITPKVAKRERLNRKGERSSIENMDRLLDLEEKAHAVFKGYSDHALLKVWEFTLASFSDYKVEFYRWNLYASLGFDPEETGGIGELLYRKIDVRLKECNEEAGVKEQEYHRASDEVRTCQALLRSADTRERARRLNAELNAKLMHARMCREMMDDAHNRAHHVSEFFRFFMESFSRYFPDYFQEVYDPEMFDVKGDLYDDSPAGFRLVYKHGRTDPTLWTPIFDAKGFQNMLMKFFIAIEPLLIADCGWEEGKGEISLFITSLIHHVQTEEFLSSALRRMAKRHQVKLKGEPLTSIEKLEKKPWSYTSGGTVHALIKCYYCVEGELAEEKKRIQTPMELLIFLLDTLKGLPPSVTNAFEKKKSSSLLMYSPQHVFTLQPGLSPFKEGWLDRGFSYTWARDRVLIPGERFYRAILLSPEEQKMLIELFIQEVLSIDPMHLGGALPPASSPVDLPSFRNHLVSTLEPFFGKEGVKERVDGFLLTAFPLFPYGEAQREGEKLLKSWPPALRFFSSKSFPQALTYSQFRYRLLEALSSFEGKKIDAPHALDKALLKGQIGPPPPLLFADTNWSTFYFAFAVNPGTLELDLWRVNRAGHNGFPMSTWRPIFSESEKSPWGIFLSPEEYRGDHLGDRSWLKV